MRSKMRNKGRMSTGATVASDLFTTERRGKRDLEAQWPRPFELEVNRASMRSLYLHLKY